MVPQQVLYASLKRKMYGQSKNVSKPKAVNESATISNSNIDYLKRRPHYMQHLDFDENMHHLYHTREQEHTKYQ